jgi:CheY-like chemotaxis protein
VATILRKYGAHVTAASSSQEAVLALTNLDEAQFDLLVSDIGMPEEDGYTMIQRIRSFTPESGGRIPAIALTAYSRASDRIRALEVGFQMHVPKPVEPAELMMVIASLTGRSVK